MRRKTVGVAFVIAWLWLTAAAVAAQVPPAAKSPGGSLSAGAGLSAFDVAFQGSWMLGETAWIDYDPNFQWAPLHGLGLEIEARDISLNRPSSLPSNFRQTTGGGGPIYFLHLSRFPNFRPYGKVVLSYAAINWNNPNPKFSHETRNISAPGVGFEYPVYHNLLARVDWEYQFWPDFGAVRSAILDPQGFTFGLMYSFHNPSKR